MAAPFAAQIQQALRQYTVEHSGAGTGDVSGPGSAVSGHLAVFDGTSGKLLGDGGPVPSGGGGGLPVSTGANKVLFDDGETQAWSDAPSLGASLDVVDAVNHQYLHLTPLGIDFKGSAASEFRQRLHLGGQDSEGHDGGSIYLRGPSNAEVGFDTNSDVQKPIGFFGFGNSDSFDWTHDGDLFFGRSLNATADNQTWFGDTVNPVFLIGTPNITVIASGANDTSFRLKNKTAPELGCIYWNGNNFVIGTQGGVGAGTARDTIVDSAANLIFATEGNSHWTLDADDGHLRPWVNSVYDIGTPDYMVRTAYLEAIVSAGNTLNLGLSGAPTPVQTLQPAASDGAGGALILTGGVGATVGGGLSLTGGFGGDGVGGEVLVRGGQGSGANAGGAVTILGGSTDEGPRGAVTVGGATLDLFADDHIITLGLSAEPTAAQSVRPAASTGADQPGADVFLLGGAPTGTGEGGGAIINGSDHANTNGGSHVTAAGATASAGGSVTILGGSAGGGTDGYGGDVTITPGLGDGAGLPGHVYVNGIVGADTQVLFNDGGAIGASDLLTLNKTAHALTLTPVADIAPTVTPTPGGGSTTWAYAIVAQFSDGSRTGLSNPGTTTEGPATLDGDHFNTVTWDAVPGAVGYFVYRTTAGGTPDTIGLLDASDSPYVDIGAAAIDSAASNTTGRLTANTFVATTWADLAQIFLEGPLVSNGDTLTLGLPGAPTADQTIQPAANSGEANGAVLNLRGRTATAALGYGGDVDLYGGDAGDGSVGAHVFVGGASSGAGGNVVIAAGSPSEGGVFGQIQLGGDTVASGSITAPDFIVSGSRFKTDTVNGHAASLSAYDVDGAAYVDFITVTNGNVPSCVVKATDFKAGDNSSGVSKVLNLGVLGTLTIKQGIITASTIAEV